MCCGAARSTIKRRTCGLPTVTTISRRIATTTMGFARRVPCLARICGPVPRSVPGCKVQVVVPCQAVASRFGQMKSWSSRSGRPPGSNALPGLFFCPRRRPLPRIFQTVSGISANRGRRPHEDESRFSWRRPHRSTLINNLIQRPVPLLLREAMCCDAVSYLLRSCLGKPKPRIPGMLPNHEQSRRFSAGRFLANR
jgi:hypothetical protein